MAKEGGLSEQAIKILKATAPVIREHGTAITATMYHLLLKNHPELENVFNESHLRPREDGGASLQAVSLANAVLAYALHCDQLSALLTPVSHMVNKHVSFNIQPEHYPIVGVTLLTAIKEVLGDAATDDIIEGWKEAYFFLADILIKSEQKMYTELSNKAGGWTGYRRMTVTEKKAEGANIMSFYLTPLNDEKLIDFLPGQYISLYIPKEDVAGSTHDHVRNYSISNKPGEGFFRISVKREADPGSVNGVISNHLHDHVEVGAELRIGPPCGLFVLDTSSRAPLVFIAGGVVLTPMISMLHTLEHEQPERKAIFIHSVKSENEHAFAEYVNELAGQELLESHVFYTRSNAERPAHLENVSSFHRERISRAKLASIVGEHTEAADFYICGPTGFVDAVRDILVGLTVDAGRMRVENFGPTLF